MKRELEHGWHQYVSLPLPAVVTIQSGVKRSRLATMAGIKGAKAKEIGVVTAASTLPEESCSTMTEPIYMPERAKGAKILTGDASACARQLLQQLRSEAHVL